MIITVPSIREALPIVGKRILEITADDWRDVKERFPCIRKRQSRIYLHLEDATTVSFAIGDGDLGFSYDGYPDGHPFTRSGK